MGYIQANLLPDEQIVYKARLHWVIFWKCCALVFLGAIFLLIQPIVGVVVILIGVLGALWPIMAYSTSEFAVTNKRVIIKTGFLRRKTLELLLRHVETISVDQSVTGRILNFGSLTLTGSGGIKEMFDNISAPLEFRRRIQGEAS
ncbi:MAG TPA: PH domain-containing protein [Candidatus Eisenbacteria bacterium]|nr:PH domain-containing protein [Candidatus Eisenbacteria bacterium]